MNTTTARELAQNLPIVTANTMLQAQGYRPTPSERAAIKAMSDWFVSHDMGARVSIKVVDFDGHRVGSLTFFSH